MRRATVGASDHQEDRLALRYSTKLSLARASVLGRRPKSETYRLAPELHRRAVGRADRA